jgi:nucleoside-diphosphate-sugar epimerase
VPGGGAAGKNPKQSRFSAFNFSLLPPCFPPVKILIVGAGYVGAACAERLLAANEKVLCRTFSAESASALRRKGLLAISGDCSLEEAWREFRFKPDAVLFCPATRGGDAADYRRTYVEGMRLTLRQMPAGARFFYTSSTSVYAQDDGAWVDETSPTAPAAATGQILLEAEQLAINSGGTVLRLAAIYGPGRLALRDRLLDGTARLPADSGRVLNQIHRDDAVSAITFLLGQSAVGGVFNVTDDAPASYAEIYQWLARNYDRPLPPTVAADAPGKRGFTSKRVSNQKLRDLGWWPQFPSFREGYAAAGGA